MNPVFRKKHPKMICMPAGCRVYCFNSRFMMHCTLTENLLMNSTERGFFTLPGESGYEDLTLKLAEKWGADVIRDSDGTKLSQEILDAGYGIYATICIIRDHNEWAKANRDKLQETFLMTSPVPAMGGGPLAIPLMKEFFAGQFELDERPESRKYWQVYDRTTDTLLPTSEWSYADCIVTIHSPVPYHTYSVSFMAFRVWEEISMYNHTTNHWTSEHLMQIDPRHEETRAYLRDWMVRWCESHPAATVVRFTSMFYNFVWIWGSDERCRHLYSDWASYDFTVSPKALDEFAERYGYSLTAEDFVNKGQLHVTHMPGTKRKADWMAFVNDFVISFGRELIDIVHRYGKKAYVFYDDSWVGVEPYNGRFREFGFDGLIKCVFSGYEARLCSGVDVPVHELRLHPYLFPVGLGGAPTFMEGGDPALDARKYWVSVRRALLRAPIDRIGLGGYLHLTEGFPDFVDCIAGIADEFRRIRALHASGRPETAKIRVAVVHSWGRLRSWSLSGHFHETYMHDLIHVNEALSGMPFEVGFLSFEDVKRGALRDCGVAINAGRAGSAWSGGDAWRDPGLVAEFMRWTAEGGVFLGVNEPSAVSGFDRFLRLAPVLGVDEDTGSRVCHGRWRFEVKSVPGLIPDGAVLHARDGVYLTDGTAHVLMAEGNSPVLTAHPFGKGCGVYLSEFRITPENTLLLRNLILHYASSSARPEIYLSDDPFVECAYWPESRTLAAVNDSGVARTAELRRGGGPAVRAELKPFGMALLEV